ncbi:MAG: uroporphyrinogen decarboxylase family protein [Candidatus Humimicrobiaceae bacterium]
MKKPDFANLKNVLMQRNAKYVPICELLIDNSVKEKILGKHIMTIKDEIDFHLKMGYDFVPIAAGILKPAQSMGKNIETTGIIAGKKEFLQYDWMRADEYDYSQFGDASKIIPQNMKIIGIGGKIFTAAWMLVGFNNFCIKLIEEPDFIKKVFDKIGRLQFEVFKRVVENKDVGAYFVSDDIAYSNGVLISAKELRSYLFPWYREMGDICRKKDIAFIYHSDGNTTEVIDDIIDCGFCAHHPIEPKALNIIEVKKKYKERLCLMGNIELDTLIRGVPEDIENLVIRNLQNVAKDSFYVGGSSNSIQKEIKIENYLKMNETFLKFGTYPINI